MIRHHAISCGKKVQVCALTGCASVLLRCAARTIHSFSGIGIGSGTIEDNVAKVMRNKKRVKAWQNIDILIVDEVSMMSMKLLETIDTVARSCRRNSKPFGGLQIIFSGDFYQICPIGRHNEPDTKRFCFESSLWFELFPKTHHVLFDSSFRQKDVLFFNVLQQIRKGTLDKESIAVLQKRLTTEPDRCVTRLFPTRLKVDEINRHEMSRLSGDLHTYALETKTNLPVSAKEKELRKTFSNMDIDAELKYLTSNVMCENPLHLKVGAHVMCTVNKELEEGYLCNGSQGIVIGFSAAPHFFPHVRFHNGINTVIEPHIWTSEHIPGIGVSQIPLIPSWAVTIHKSQGSTMEAIEVDIGSSVFDYGQTYVALSRVTSLDGLFINGLDTERIYVHPKVHEFYDMIET